MSINVDSTSKPTPQAIEPQSTDASSTSHFLSLEKCIGVHRLVESKTKLPVLSVSPMNPLVASYKRQELAVLAE